MLIKNKAGFTLIELLVVVAIIGLLTTITLGYLETAKKRGNDAGVQGNFETIRTRAEFFYVNQIPNSYLPSGGVEFGIASCPTTYDASGTNMFVKDKTMSDALNEAIKRGNGTSYCYNSAEAYAVAVGLKSNANSSWCVDTSGVAKKVDLPPQSAINNVSFGCN